MSVTLQKYRFYPKRQIIISREPVTVWTWLTPHFTRKSMFLLIAYIIHGQKSNGKALNVILGQKGTKKPKSHISVTGVYINLVDPSFQLENACFCQYFTLSISIRAINRIQNQFSGKKSTLKGPKGQNRISQKSLVVSQKAVVDSLLSPEYCMGILWNVKWSILMTVLRSSIIWSLANTAQLDIKC